MRKKRKRLAKPSPDKIGMCYVLTEGIEYAINWHTFPINGFVFLRCVATDEILPRIKRSAIKHGIGVVTKIGIRNGYWGIGLWRTK
jgi:hypothetical protein